MFPNTKNHVENVEMCVTIMTLFVFFVNGEFQQKKTKNLLRRRLLCLKQSTALQSLGSRPQCSTSHSSLTLQPSNLDSTYNITLNHFYTGQSSVLQIYTQGVRRPQTNADVDGPDNVTYSKRASKNNAL